MMMMNTASSMLKGSIMALLFAVIAMTIGVKAASFETNETTSNEAPLIASEPDRIFFCGTADRSELFSILDDGTELISHGKVEAGNDTDIFPNFHKQSNMLAYSTHVRPWSRIFVKRLDAPMLDDAKLLVDFGSAAPFFSPDGRQIVFNRVKDNTASISISSINGRRIEHFDRQEEERSDIFPQFSHDGRFIVYLRAASSGSNPKQDIFRVNVDDPDTHEKIAELSFYTRSTILVSPIEDKVFTIQHFDRTICVKFIIVDFKDMNDVKSTIIPYNQDLVYDEFYPISWSSNGKFVYLLRGLSYNEGKRPYVLVKLDVQTGELTTIYEIPA